MVRERHRRSFSRAEMMSQGVLGNGAFEGSVDLKTGSECLSGQACDGLKPGAEPQASARR